MGNLDAEKLEQRWRTLKEALTENESCRVAAGLSAEELGETLEALDRLVSEQVHAGSTSGVLYVDGAARGNPGPAGAGIRIESETGERLLERAVYLGEATNNVAEYQALIHGLREARDLGLRRLRVRTDSQLLARQVNGRYRVKNGVLIDLWSQVRELMRGFDSCEIEEIPRAQNKDADRLANLAVDRAQAEGSL